MEGLDLSFNNKKVIFWFAIVIPVTIISILLYIFLPRDFYLIPTLLPIVAICVYYVLVSLARNKKE